MISEKKYDFYLEILVGVVFFCIIGGFLYKENYPNKKINELHQEALVYSSNMEFNGIVVKKSVDELNNNSPVLTLNNGKRVYVYNYFFQKIKLKDSIVKKKHTHKFKVFRGVKVFNFNMKEFIDLQKQLKTKK